MKSFQKIVQTSEGSLDNSSHGVGNCKSSNWGLSFEDAFNGQGLYAEAMEETVITTRHPCRLL